MKAIILAGGEGMRMRPLTDDKPKQLVEVAGKPILDHILEALPPEITELILVIGYRGDQIRAHYGSEHRGRPIAYVAQTERKGTMHALRLCESYLKERERFLVMYADDVHGMDGLAACVASPALTLSVLSVEDPRRFGVVETNAEGRIVDLVEKPENPKSNLVSTGVFVLDKNIFRYRAARLLNGEEYLAEAVAAMIRDGRTFYAVPSSLWIPIGYPGDIERAELLLK